MRFYIIILFWLLGFLFLCRIPFPRKTEKPLFSPADTSIIVPARNEEAALDRLLRSIRVQSCQPAEIIVVDDQSADATADVARRHGATVISSAGPPDGWVGKTWGCWQGAQRAKGNVFIFLDADTFLHQDGLTKITSTFEGDGLLSIQPFHAMEQAYERFSALFNIVVMASMKAFSVFGTIVKPLGAFGPCIVCTRETYFATGGHATVRGEILEHLTLGQQFVRLGRPVRCYGGKGALSFRMYPGGLGSLFRGFARSFATGANSMSILALLPVVFWIIGAFGVTRHLVQSVLFGDMTGLISWAALDLAYAVQVHWMLYRIGNFGFLTALLFQLPLLFFGIAFCWSLFLTFFRRQVRWKGRLVKTGAGESIV